MADQELKVKFSGDDSDLMAAFARLKNELDGLNPHIVKPQKSFDSFGDSFKNFIKGYLGVEAVLQGGRMFLEAAKQTQKYENQLKVASETQQGFAKNTAFLEGLASKYNKNVIELGGSFAQLSIATKGTNLEGAETERLFAAVTAASSALQLSVDDTNGVFRAFIQMVSKGNVQAEELRGQLGERLYGAFNLAAQAMGKSTSELNKMLENGEVLASDLLPKLATELENTFGAQAEENARNLGSAIEFATGQITLFFGEFGKSSGITGFFTDLAKEAGDFVSVLREVNKFEGGWGVATTINSALHGDESNAAAQAKWRKSNAKNISTTGDYISGMPGTFRSNPYELPSTLYKDDQSVANPAAEEKARKAAEKAAKKAQRELDKWTREQIQQSKDRIAEGLLNAQIENTVAFGTRNSGITTPSERTSKPGLSNIYDSNSFDKIGEQFTNPVATSGSMNYDHIIAGMDDVIAQISDRYHKVETVTDEFGERLNESMKQAFAGATAQAIEGLGNIVGGLISGTVSMQDVGNTFLGIMANLFESIGKALAQHAALLIAADIAISTNNPALAAAGAVLAYAAAGVVRSSMKQAGADAFYSGGIVAGQAGVDKVPAFLSRGEMVLNGSHQNKLWGMINGAHTSGEMFGGVGGNSRNDQVNVSVYGRLKSGDIDLSGQAGRRKNNYFVGG